MIRKYRQDLYAAIAVSLAWIALACPWLKPGRSWSDYQDDTNFLQPLMSLASRLWQQGGPPLFTSEVVGGYPWYANPHFNVKYPLYFLWTSWYATPQAASMTLHRLTLLHFWILSLTTLFLCRTLSIRPALAGLVALGFAFGAAAQGSLAYVTSTAATSWMPAVLGGVVLICTGKLRTGVLTIAVAASLQIYAMPAQVFVMTFLAAGMIASSWLLMAAIRSGLPAIRKKLLAFALAGAGVAALTGPYLAAVASFHARSIRWVGGDRPPIVGPGQRIPKDALAEYGLGLRDLSNVIILQNKLFAAGHVFVGGMVCFFAAAAVIWGVKRRKAAAVCFGLLTAVFLMFTLRSFATHIGYYLPLENKIREVSWYGLVASLGLFALAGIGADEALRRLPWGRRVRGALLGGMLAGVATIAWGVHELGARASGETFLWCFLSAACLGIAIGANHRATGARSGHGRLPVKVAALAVVGSLGLAVIPWHLLPAPTWAENEINSPEALDARKTIAKLVRLAPDTLEYRADLPAVGHANWSMFGLYDGVRTFQGYITPQIWKTFALLYWIRDHPEAARIAGMRYSIVPAGSKPPGSFWRLQKAAGNWAIEEDPGAFPMVYFGQRISGTFDPETPASYWNQVDAEERKTGDVFLPPGLAARRDLVAPAEPPAKFTFSRRSEQRWELVVESPVSRLLVVNEFHAPEWQASIDGRPASLWTVNLTQCGIVTPPGVSHVDFFYEPRILGWPAVRWSWGGWGAFVALCFLLAGRAGRRLDQP